MIAVLFSFEYVSDMLHVESIDIGSADSSLATLSLLFVGGEKEWIKWRKLKGWGEREKDKKNKS